MEDFLKLSNEEKRNIMRKSLEDAAQTLNDGFCKQVGALKAGKQAFPGVVIANNQFAPLLFVRYDGNDSTLKINYERLNAYFEQIKI